MYSIRTIAVCTHLHNSRGPYPILILGPARDRNAPCDVAMRSLTLSCASCAFQGVSLNIYANNPIPTFKERVCDTSLRHVRRVASPAPALGSVLYARGSVGNVPAGVWEMCRRLPAGQPAALLPGKSDQPDANFLVAPAVHLNSLFRRWCEPLGDHFNQHPCGLSSAQAPR